MNTPEDTFNKLARPPLKEVQLSINEAREKFLAPLRNTRRFKYFSWYYQMRLGALMYRVANENHWTDDEILKEYQIQHDIDRKS